MANYDLMYGKGITELFGEEFLDFITSENRDNEYRLVMELKLTQCLKVLNARYHRNSFEIENNLELCKQYWNFYKVGITFLAKFFGYFEIKNETCEELSYYLLEYLVDGNCNTDFIKDTFSCMVLVNGDLEKLSHK